MRIFRFTVGDGYILRTHSSRRGPPLFSPKVGAFLHGKGGNRCLGVHNLHVGFMREHNYITKVVDPAGSARTILSKGTSSLRKEPTPGEILAPKPPKSEILAARAGLIKNHPPLSDTLPLMTGCRC